MRLRAQSGVTVADCDAIRDEQPDANANADEQPDANANADTDSDSRHALTDS